MMVDEVSGAIRDVGAAEVMSRFRRLAAGDILEKGPGDLVTIADRECERILSGRLRTIRDIPVVGEEATAADPSLLELVDTADAAWIVDPVDGTANFVAGDPRFALMVALVERGVTTTAWVWHPDSDSMLTAERGGGTKRNGTLVFASEADTNPRGIVKRKYMPEPARSQLAEFPDAVGRLVPGMKSAGIEYAALVDGRIDFLCYWRTLPWDHAPCGLIAQEAGLRVARIDGSPYRPGDGRSGLLAAERTTWDAVASVVRTAFAD